jgi:hypothetical protein
MLDTTWIWICIMTRLAFSFCSSGGNSSDDRGTKRGDIFFLHVFCVSFGGIVCGRVGNMMEEEEEEEDFGTGLNI